MKIYLAPLEGITGYTYRRALTSVLEDLINILSHLSFQTRKVISAPEKRKTSCLRIMKGCMQSRRF